MILKPITTAIKAVKIMEALMSLLHRPLRVLIIVLVLGITASFGQVTITNTDTYLTVDQMLLANEINESGEPYAEAIGYNLDDLDPFEPFVPDNTAYVLGIENYEYSRYQLGVVIARSGLGLHMMWSPFITAMAAMETAPDFDGKYTGGMTNGYKEDDELMKNIMHFVMLANHMAPMNPWPQFGEFVSGSPHYMQPADPDNFGHDFATLRWDRSLMTKQLSPGAMGQTLMKQYLWAQDMLGGFHDGDENEVEPDGIVSPDSTGKTSFDPDNNVFYGGDNLDGFVGQVLTAEAINKVKNIITNLAYDGSSLGMVDPMTYDPNAGIKYFPHLIAVEEVPIEGGMLPPKPQGYSVVDAGSWLFDQVSLIWGTLSYKNMMDPNNDSSPQHLAYHSVFDGDPFPADMSVTGMPGPFDLMKGASKVIFQNLMAMHFNSDAGSFIDTAELTNGSVVRGNEISSFNAGYSLVVLKLFVEEFAGTPLESMAQNALQAQADFVLNNLHDANGGFYNSYTISEGPAGEAKTILAQAGIIRGLYAAYQATDDTAYLTAANEAYSYLIQNFYDSDQHGFHTTHGVDLVTYNPKIVAALSGALREARLVGGNEDAIAIYVNFWNTVVNKMQMAEGDATGETGSDSDGDGIPFIPEQPNGIAPVFAAEATQNLTGPTLVEGEDKPVVIPTAYKLYQNYPNPFNPSTQISFELPEQGQVVLEIYNIRGEKIATLINRGMSAGSHSVNFDAGHLTSGVYLYRITMNGYHATMKMNLLK